MDENDILVILPRVYHLDDIPRTETIIMHNLKMSIEKKNHNKIRELVDMGFLVRSGKNKFIPDKKKIWSFWKDTPVGNTIIQMVDENRE